MTSTKRARPCAPSIKWYTVKEVTFDSKQKEKMYQDCQTLERILDDVGKCWPITTKSKVKGELIKAKAFVFGMCAALEHKHSDIVIMSLTKDYGSLDKVLECFRCPPRSTKETKLLIKEKLAQARELLAYIKGAL